MNLREQDIKLLEQVNVAIKWFGHECGFYYDDMWEDISIEDRKSLIELDLADINGNKNHKGINTLLSKTFVFFDEIELYLDIANDGDWYKLPTRKWYEKAGECFYGTKPLSKYKDIKVTTPFYTVKVNGKCSIKYLLIATRALCMDGSRGPQKFYNIQEDETELRMAVEIDNFST